MNEPTEVQTDFSLSAEGREQFQCLLERYPTRDSVLMPALWLIQDEYGYVSSTAVDWLVASLGVSHARVWELLTFYTMFHSEPQAEYVLQVCHNICCHLVGVRNIIAHLEKRLGIRLGETTPDGKFTLEGVECLGGCGHGPVMQLGKHYYEYLTPEKVDGILDSLKKGVVPRADSDRELEE